MPDKPLPEIGRTPIEVLIRPFQVFARNKISGAILLLVASGIALVWANSPWKDSYFSLLATRVTVGIGDFALSKPLILWINDGLMAIFFFVVGLEIKREVLAGELRTLRKAMLPIAAAIGGMVLPAGLYLLLNSGQPGARGWGVPMATDIAFALGVLLLLGSRVPLGLKIFLTALAIVDDLGAILVIAIFYSDTISIASLAAGGVLFGISIAANMLGVRSALVYFILGLFVWLCFLKSGVHATLAAVLMAFTIPSRSRINAETFTRTMDILMDRFRGGGRSSEPKLLTADQQHTMHKMESTVDNAGAPLQELEHSLMGLVTFVVMPVFALANAGVTISGNPFEAFTDRIFLGILLGLFVGKQAGVLLFAWGAVKAGWAELPEGVTWRQVHAAGVLAGIGFTMSLFVGSLAFESAAQQDVAKLAVLFASLLGAGAGTLLLHLGLKRES